MPGGPKGEKRPADDVIGEIQTETLPEIDIRRAPAGWHRGR